MRFCKDYTRHAMNKKIISLGICLLYSQILFCTQTQDIVVGGLVISKGTVDCLSKYETIKKEILQHYKRPFNVLDIGSEYGYYSFNINRLSLNKFENLKNAHIAGTTLNILDSELKRINNFLAFFKIKNNDYKCLEFLRKVALLD